MGKKKKSISLQCKDNKPGPGKISKNQISDVWLLHCEILCASLSK